MSFYVLGKALEWRVRSYNPRRSLHDQLISREPDTGDPILAFGSAYDNLDSSWFFAPSPDGAMFYPISPSLDLGQLILWAYEMLVSRLGEANAPHQALHFYNIAVGNFFHSRGRQALIGDTKEIERASRRVGFSLMGAAPSVLKILLKPSFADRHFVRDVYGPQAPVEERQLLRALIEGKIPYIERGGFGLRYLPASKAFMFSLINPEAWRGVYYQGEAAVFPSFSFALGCEFAALILRDQYLVDLGYNEVARPYLVVRDPSAWRDGVLAPGELLALPKIPLKLRRTAPSLPQKQKVKRRLATFRRQLAELGHDGQRSFYGFVSALVLQMEQQFEESEMMRTTYPNLLEAIELCRQAVEAVDRDHQGSLLAIEDPDAAINALIAAKRSELATQMEAVSKQIEAGRVQAIADSGVEAVLPELEERSAALRLEEDAIAAEQAELAEMEAELEASRDELLAQQETLTAEISRIRRLLAESKG